MSTLREDMARHAWSLRGAVLTGLVLRLVASIVAYGPFASDDYVYAIAPAWKWLVQPDAPYASAIRSPLLARAIWLVFELGEAVGVSEPTLLLRLAYLALGLWSLTAIPAVYTLTRSRLGNRAAMWAGYLTAASALMPYISTRALIEVVAIPLLVWGLVFIDKARASLLNLYALLGGLLLGLAALLRFQLGLVGACVALILLWPRQEGTQRAWGWRATGALGLGAMAALLVQAVLDVSVGRPPLSTPWHYVLFNLQSSAQFGTSPWYTYLLQLLAYTAPPATLVLARPLAAALRRHALVGIVLITFVAAHSLIGHKEDRFLFSVLPLCFVGLGAALAHTWTGERWQRRGARFFVAVNVVALIVVTLGDGQRNMTAPLRAVAQSGLGAHLLAVGWRTIPSFYVGRNVTHAAVRHTEELWREIEARGVPTHILWRVPPPTAVREELSRQGVTCDAGEVFHGGPSDRLLVAFNAESNKRRRPTLLMRCRTRATAQASQR